MKGMIKMKSKRKKVNIGRNEPHMRFCQDARRSGMAGFHVTKRNDGKHERREYRVRLRKYDFN